MSSRNSKVLRRTKTSSLVIPSEGVLQVLVPDKAIVDKAGPNGLKFCLYWWRRYSADPRER